MEKVHLLGFTEDEMKSFAREMGEAAFRGKQIFRWIWRGARDFSQMTDLPAGLREKLDETACIGCLDVLDVQEDEKDGTRKFLFGLEGRQHGGKGVFHEVQVWKFHVRVV